MKIKKGQSTLEYAILITVIVAAIAAMNLYMQRAAQGKIRESSDRLGEQFSADKTTYKQVNYQPSDMQTSESFGLASPDANATVSQGLSYYRVDKAVEVESGTTKVAGSASETTEAPTVANERLFPKAEK